jgi:predicted Zn-dependent protease
LAALKFHSKTNARFLRFLLPLACCVFAFYFLSACAQNFVTKKRQVKFISQKTEIEIGKKAKAEIVKEYGIYKDLDWQVYLDEVGQRVAKQSDRPELQYDFTIIDTDILNAFAVPGGFVFVTRGILGELKDEAELSIVLGHEITHIAAWHGLEMLQKAGLLGTLTALGVVGGAALGAGEAAIALAQAAGIYENLYLLGYGRDNELQADQYGIFYASRAGYDPEAALTFFKRLDKIEQDEMAGQQISPYWLDHPPTKDRLKRAAYWIAQVEQEEKQPSLTYNRDKYLAMVARLPHGESAERGVIEGQTYKNVPFGITLEVPEGWKLDNSRAETLVAFSGPAPGIKGILEHVHLSQEMGVKDFAKQISRQWGVQEAVTRDVDYPAGHGLLWQYGGDYERFRTLLLVRGDEGYALMCQSTSDLYLEYLVDCEKIMRSLQIQ